MELLDALRQRRSVKRYDPNHQMSDEELRKLFQGALLAPTSFNMQNWHFVAVRDAEQKEKLCAASWNQAQVKDGSLVIVLCGDYTAHRRTDRYLRNAPSEVKEALSGMVENFYEGKDAMLRDEACRSLGFAGMAFMLLAKDMGYDSCPMIGFDPKQVAEIVGLDADHPPLLMIVIGKGTEPARPRMGLMNLEEVVSLDRFGDHGLVGDMGDV